MESEENEGYPKQGTTMRSDKNVAVDYDEDRVRLELVTYVANRFLFTFAKEVLFLLIVRSRARSINYLVNFSCMR